MLDEITANVTPRNNSFTVPHHLTNGITRHTPNARTSQLTQTTEQIKRGYKVLVILRGLPGSGKSYLARKIVEITVGCQDHHNFIYSADDYFMRRGLYQFDGSKIQDAHAFNQQRAFEAMRRGVSPVIIDNTNTQMWEMKPYAMAASQYAYIIEILEPDTPWAFNDRELFRKNIHGVPRVKLKEMLGRYEKNITSRKLINAYGIRYGNMLPPQLRTYPPLVESAKECVERPENATPSIDDMLMHCEDKVKPTKAKAAIPETDLSTWGVSETALHSWDICTPVVTKQETDSAESVTCGFMMVSRVETSDAATNTCSSDFVLVANPDGVAKVLVANNRDINEQCSFRIPPPRQKILVDKGSMVGEDLVEQCLDKKEALERLSAVFPSIPHIYLREIHDRCQGDLNWAIDVLCDDNLHNLMTPQEEEPEQEEQPEQEEEKQNPNLQEQNITTPPPSPQEEHNTTAVADAVEREQLKRLLEEKVVIRDDFYSEHTLKLKSRNNFDQNAQPSTSKVQTDTVVDSDVDMDDFDLETASESTTSASDTQDMIELNLGDAFVTELESKLQEPTLQYPKGFLPIVQVPVALARQLYALYIESVYQQMDAQNEVLDMLIKEDEEFARKIQAQEQQQQQQQEPTTLPEIMQEQYELSLCKRETEQWKNLTPDDFAAKMTKKKLFESFPNIGKDVLVEIWQAHGNNYKETVESILASSPEQAALSQGEIENPPVPEEIVEEMREVHNQVIGFILPTRRKNKSHFVLESSGSSISAKLILLGDYHYQRSSSSMESRFNNCCVGKKLKKLPNTTINKLNNLSPTTRKLSSYYSLGGRLYNRITCMSLNTLHSFIILSNESALS